MKIDFKYRILVISLLILVLILSGVIYLLKIQWREQKHSSCIASSEEVRYEIHENEKAQSRAKIYIRNKNTDEVVSEFQVENIMARHYHPYEAHKCGIYLVREFNYDYEKGKPLPDFRMEVWRYRYDSSGEKLVEENDFRVDPRENYLVLEQGYLGKPNYALVIKDLKTKGNVFELLLGDVIEKYPLLEGIMSLGEWTKDSRYFWGRTSMTAYTLGFFRIDTTSWNIEIFEVPDGILGGSALNIEKGYVTRHPDYTWIGMQEDYERIKKEWQEQGKISSLYLYNLFTKEQTLLANTDEPLWFFKPKWISDTELEYELPSGERKVFKIE